MNVIAETSLSPSKKISDEDARSGECCRVVEASWSREILWWNSRLRPYEISRAADYRRNKFNNHSFLPRAIPYFWPYLYNASPEIDSKSPLMRPTQMRPSPVHDSYPSFPPQPTTRSSPSRLRQIIKPPLRPNPRIPRTIHLRQQQPLPLHLLLMRLHPPSYLPPLTPITHLPHSPPHLMQLRPTRLRVQWQRHVVLQCPCNLPG